MHRFRFWFLQFLLGAWLALASSAADLAATPLPEPPASQRLGYKKVELLLGEADKHPEKLISNENIQGWLAYKDWLTNDAQALQERWNLERRYHHADDPIYVGNVKHFLAGDYPKPSPAPSGHTDPANGVAEAGRTDKSHTQPKISFKLRQSYTDVLSSEDPSQTATGSSPKKVDDLKGATVSYTRDFDTSSDIWVAQAAVLVPIVFTTAYTPNSTEGGWISYGFVPSVTINRVSGVNKQTMAAAASNTKDVDQLAARLGIFGKYGTPGDIFDTITVRGFATEATDTGFRSNVPAGQLEVEPQFHFSEKVQVGYLVNLLPKTPGEIPGKTDFSDNSYFAYQLRFRMHFDGGDIVDAGKTGAPEKMFARIGPIVELRLAPLIFHHLSLTVTDQYLATLAGQDDHDNLFTVSAEYKIYDNQATQQSISLKALYTRGGIDLTKQDVKSFQLGLGATF